MSKWWRCSATEAFERFDRQMEWHREDVEQARKQARAELRDRFAMAALTGLLVQGWTSELGREERAANAWAEADAMLKARGDD